MLIRTFFTRLASIGSRPEDSEDDRLQKSLMVLSCIPFLLTGFLWGLMYMAFGERTAGWIPFLYGLFSIGSLIYFEITKNFEVFRFSQLFLILVLPFALMLTLGGYVEGSAVILWGFIAPLGAVMFDKAGRAVYWFIAYLTTVLISGFVTHGIDIPNVLKPWQIHMFFVINFAGVSTLVFLIFHYFVRQKNYFQQRTEELLLNILPHNIAKELREKGKTEAKLYSDVTVLFTDFEDFSSITEKMEPQELVNVIHQCYSTFDEITEKYGVAKIKTIGDSYMCAAGINGETDGHAERCVAAGLEMCMFIATLGAERRQAGKPSFNVRIGVHSGAVIAGIVGKRKFAFDIWGDTVNIASRMESHGAVGKVNISSATYALVRNKFSCTFSGQFHAGNKGELDMYFVE